VGGAGEEAQHGRLCYGVSAAKLAARGFTNERGNAFSAASISSMLEALNKVRLPHSLVFDVELAVTPLDQLRLRLTDHDFGG
jgi:hypothetical protein